MTSGYVAMFIFLIVARFKMHPKRFLVIIPIVIFSAIIELINVPLLSLLTIQQPVIYESGSIITYMFQILYLVIKIWFNMFVIFLINVINISNKKSINVWITGCFLSICFIVSLNKISILLRITLIFLLHVFCYYLLALNYM